MESKKLVVIATLLDSVLGTQFIRCDGQCPGVNLAIGSKAGHDLSYLSLSDCVTKFHWMFYFELRNIVGR